jgi:tRNA threonylcarbamoyl adenosine modification protein YeaZ
MNILALDTSMGACSVAVLLANGEPPRIVAREEPMTRGHAEALMPMIAEVMDEAGLGFPALDLIAATVGPGSFTGVRIAIAAARGFALVTSAKLWGTDSLTVMAHVARGLGISGPLAVAVDARRAMLYFGLYDGDGARLEGPLLIAPENAVAMLPKSLSESLSVVVGSGAAALAEAASSQGRAVRAELPDLQPNAAALAALALAANETVRTLRPLYLRPPDAKPQNTAGIARR